MVVGNGRKMEGNELWWKGKVGSVEGREEGWTEDGRKLIKLKGNVEHGGREWKEVLTGIKGRLNRMEGRCKGMEGGWKGMVGSMDGNGGSMDGNEGRRD